MPYWIFIILLPLTLGGIQSPSYDMIRPQQKTNTRSNSHNNTLAGSLSNRSSQDVQDGTPPVLPSTNISDNHNILYDYSHPLTFQDVNTYPVTGSAIDVSTATQTHPSAPGPTVRRRKKKKRTETTTRSKWTRDDYKTLMKLYYISDPSTIGYRKRLHQAWINHNLFESS